ncbi:MAG: GTP-binding protein [Opitutaceae bacterium]|nr:GTP-binding protein [Opitutaceae bacterium]
MHRSASSPAALPAVTIVTGFLGAGKTTWLTRALTEPHGLKLAVIVNDVGAINIDAALVRRVGGNGGPATTIELTNGCICCSVRDELAETLAGLAARREHDHIIVECSGVAEPQPLVRLFTERNEFGRGLSDFARLHAVLAIVDVSELLRHCRDAAGHRRAAREDERPRPLSDLMFEQIEGADIVALNKPDLVAFPEWIDEAAALVAGVNPRAEIHRVVQSELPAGVWPGPDRYAERTEAPATWVRVLNRAAGQATPGLHRGGFGALRRPAPVPVETSAEKYGLHTFLFSERRPFDAGRLAALFAAGLPGVVRAKGFFWARERPDDIGFLSLAGGVYRCEPVGTWAAALREGGVLTEEEIPAGIRATWQEPHGDRRQELVFIGRGLDEASLRRELEACLS